MLQILEGSPDIFASQSAHSRLMEWISTTDYPAQQSDIIKHRHEGTAQWFLDAPEVARWLSEPKSTLFCPGIPGAGKTIVAAVVIEHLLHSVQNSSYGVAYVYCNYQTQYQQDVLSMLAAILKQLVQGRTLSVKPVETLYQIHANKGTRLSLREIFDALQDVIIHYPFVYIVIDALDECRRGNGIRSEFLARLRDLQAVGDIRLMVTSRFIPDIEDEFDKALRLEVQASDEDVRCFVAGQIFQLPQCIQRDPALQDMVQEKIVQAADGMYASFDSCNVVSLHLLGSF
ncbi:hypothetical protein K505DRAFT_259399 [Melanomma pulvis-pyrius CBS 109.77]|uniref:Nephrocystin 3-like N-terminal domain-containing protein n=1 Tax=Melanomma pulvis-pyrius CBS 109.77 TaxID=1314802 RepID=A0A6A6WRF2_9PLEO|nr:hypothetical protein K505DRAFT_259399 [Melanomma pulvis-pyrius CBS 109.77]